MQKKIYQQLVLSIGENILITEQELAYQNQYDSSDSAGIAVISR